MNSLLQMYLGKHKLNEVREFLAKSLAVSTKYTHIQKITPKINLSSSKWVQKTVMQPINMK